MSFGIVTGDGGSAAREAKSPCREVFVPNPPRRWMSFHIHHGDDCYGPELDRLIVRAVGPRVERWWADGTIRSYFFLRYGEGGSHLRLRLEGVDPRQPDQEPARKPRLELRQGLRSELRQALEVYLGGDFELREMTYEPELERYGGPRGVAVAEELFHASSRVALRVLRARDGRQHRFGKALLLAVVLAHVFRGGTEGAAAFLHRYSDDYRRLLGREVSAPKTRPAEPPRESELERAVGSLVAALGREPCPLADAEDVSEPGAGGRALLGAWLRSCRRARLGLDALPPGPVGARTVRRERLAASYLHVHNNRLGLSIPQEIHLTRLAAHALDHLGADR